MKKRISSFRSKLIKEKEIQISSLEVENKNLLEQNNNLKIKNTKLEEEIKNLTEKNQQITKNYDSLVQKSLVIKKNNNLYLEKYQIQKKSIDKEKIKNKELELKIHFLTLKLNEKPVIKYFKSILRNPIVTGSSYFPSNGPEKAITEYDQKNYFFSEDLPDQWLQIQFINKINIHSYLMKFPNNWKNCPSNFLLEISLDGKKWEEVDKQININFKGKEFKKDLLKSYECKFLRITNIGKNTDNSNHLQIHYLEFFGVFDELKLFN